MPALSTATRPLFKYIESKYVMGMLAFGHLRIGTLYDFRKVEQYGTEIGDKDEGKKTEFEDNESFTLENAPPLAQEMTKGMYASVDASTVSFNDCIFDKTYESSDCYVYCVTKEFNQDVMVASGYDACVRIDNPDMFFHNLSKCIEKKRRIIDGLLDSCVYMNRRQHYSERNDLHPALIKPPSLMHQKEVRSIWTPAEGEKVAPFLVTCQQLTQYCSRYR